MSARRDWYTIARAGWYGPLRDSQAPPVGPWHGFDNAHEALVAWRLRVGEHAGSAEAAMAIRVRGPFSTREVAQQGAWYNVNPDAEVGA